ncbi:MAG: hypothetical protein HZC40_08340 [Chloroflexi bacterium]|nr:hypothetical protein [Chloroflexota bacterium]
MPREHFYTIVLIAFALALAACSPTAAPTAPSAPATAPTAIAVSTLAPTATPTLTLTPLPTFTPTITPTPAPDSSAALALARTQIKNFNEKDFTVSATWLADKRALVVIQSKTTTDAWVLLPAAKELTQVPTTAGPEGKISLVRFGVDEKNGKLVGYTAFSNETVGKWDAQKGYTVFVPEGEKKFYWTNWQGKEQWLTVLPINPDLGGTPQDLLTALSRPTLSRGRSFPVVVWEPSGLAKEPFIFDDSASYLERLLTDPEVVRSLNGLGLHNLPRFLGGVEISNDMGPSRNNPNRQDFMFSLGNRGLILWMNAKTLTPSENKGIGWGGGGVMTPDGNFALASKGTITLILALADREAGLWAKYGSDPRTNDFSQKELRANSIRVYEEIAGKGLDTGIANLGQRIAYLKGVGGLLPGQAVIQSSVMSNQEKQ